MIRQGHAVRREAMDKLHVAAPVSSSRDAGTQAVLTIVQQHRILRHVGYTDEVGNDAIDVGEQASDPTSLNPQAILQHG